MNTNAIHSWMKGPPPVQSKIVDIADSPDAPPDLTASPHKAFAKITNYWRAIWTNLDPPQTTLSNIILEHLPPVAPWPLQPITPAEIRRTAAQSKSTRGPDGWASQEIAALPIALLQPLADIMNCMEATGILPSAATTINITLIPKSDGSAHYSKLRPISVASILWRTDLPPATMLMICEPSFPLTA